MPSFEVAKRCSTVNCDASNCAGKRLNRLTSPIGVTDTNVVGVSMLSTVAKAMSCLSAVPTIWMVLLAGSGIACRAHVPFAWRASANNLPETSSSALIHRTWSLAATCSIAWLLLGAMTNVGCGFRPARIAATSNATTEPGWNPPSGSISETITWPSWMVSNVAVSGIGSSTQRPSRARIDILSV